MTDVLPSASASNQHFTRTAAPLLLIGVLVFALGLRLQVAGLDRTTSPTAALLFAIVLLGAALGSGLRTRLTWQHLLLGLGGAAPICAMPMLARLINGSATTVTTDGYVQWALIVTAVAVAEEALIRGALYDALARSHGIEVAVAVTALSFAFLHVPLYGWHALPLDLVVGWVLSELRRSSGSWTAPAVAHSLADLAGWWLR